MNTLTPDQREKTPSKKVQIASYLLAPTLALAALIHSGAPVAEATNYHIPIRPVSELNQAEPTIPGENTPITSIDLSSGMATWSAAETGPRLPSVSPEWGVLDEIAIRAAKNDQPQPRLGSNSTSLYDSGLLSDGITNPGVTKAVKLSIKNGHLVPGVTIDDIGISFPNTSESVGFILQADSGVLRITQKYQPGDSGWLQRDETIQLSGVDFGKDIDLTAVWATGGEVRKLLVQNGVGPRNEIRPLRQPPALAYTGNRP